MSNEQGQHWKYVIPYGNAVAEHVRLRAAASAVLHLEADAASLDGASEYEEVAWDPSPHREAQTVEIRARAIALMGNFGANEQPLIRWRHKFGHGTGLWELPIPKTPGLLRVNLDYTVPARGLMFRMMNRELRLLFKNGGNVAHTGSLTDIQLLVTINPVGESDFQAQQYAQSRFNIVDPLARNSFPISAREWALRGESGLPIPVGTTVNFFSLTGVLYASADASNFADWHPIPEPAQAWNVNANVLDGVYAHYR